MMKITNGLIQTIFLLAVSVSLIAAVNLGQVLAQNPSNTDLNVLKGAITSTSNNGNTTDPAWVLGGVYRFTEFNSSSPAFNASFYMTKIDGTAEHIHSIYDLKLSNSPVVDSSSNSTMLNGTTTVTLKDGPVSNVPTQIELLDESAIAITVDGNSTNNHFGTTPIYGTQHLICVEAPNLCK
ncbi:MAG: hypothetical protein P0116_09625 [Candidatus Nitrosocosmicus sp.]|nr:hypothetical protein [Candidatus Nitrosocosmicus sp.]